MNAKSKNLLLGIGNVLNGDDGVGCYIAEKLQDSSHWNTIDCSTAPENFSGQVKKYEPVLVVIVDAAVMNLPPGTIRQIDVTKIREVGFSTHTMSLAHFISYLSEECSNIILVGIEPEDTSFGNSLSDKVKQNADKLIHILIHQDITQIPHL